MGGLARLPECKDETSLSDSSGQVEYIKTKGPEDGGDDFSLEEDHLAKMMEMTSERFTPAMIQRAQHGPNYFDVNGMLVLSSVASGLRGPFN